MLNKRTLIKNLGANWLNPIHYYDGSFWIGLNSGSMFIFFYLLLNNVFPLVICYLPLVFIIFLCLFNEIILWFIELINDSYKGKNTINEQKAFILAFKIFLFTEIMLFFALFWTFIHFRLTGNIWLFMIWPPLGIIPIFAFGLPFTNLLILIYSSIPLQ